MIIAYLNVVLSLCNERECMEKGLIESSPNTVYLSCLLGPLCRSKWPNWSILKGFACHWRFVTRSQQLSSKSFLLRDIEIASFSLSRPLLQCFKRQASKRNNLTKERAANVSRGVLELRVTYTKSPPLDITVILLLLVFFFWRPKFLYGDHFIIEGRQKATFWKSELGALFRPTLFLTT